MCLVADNSPYRTEVLDDLLVRYSNVPQTVKCFFFCDSRQQKESSSQAKTILGCLCRQYLQQVGDLDVVEPKLSDFFEDNTNLNIEEIAEFFVSCIGLSRETYIVIDGLDECISHEREVVLAALKEVLDRARKGDPDDLENVTSPNAALKIFITYTMPNDIQPNRFLKADHQQHTSSDDASEDFSSAIDRLLQDRKDKVIWKFHEPSLLLDVSRALHKGSQNM